MSNAQDRGWGNPDTPGFRDAHIITVKAAGISVAMHREVAPLFRHFLTELGKHYPLARYADDWGYANRDVRGHPGVKSNHSWGLAVDVDATVNPMTTSTNARHEFQRTVVEPLLKPYEGFLVWGGDYTGDRKDYMHFEWVGTINDARRISAQVLGGKRTPLAFPLQPGHWFGVVSNDPHNHSGLNHPDAEAIVKIRRRLTAGTSTRFDPKLEAKVIEFQKAHHLTPDGHVGSVTWSVLFRA